MEDLSKFGHFDEEKKCFILTQEPPRKWVNMLYNQVGGTEMFCEASNIGDGVTCVRDEDGVMVDIVSYDSKYA